MSPLGFLWPHRALDEHQNFSDFRIWSEPVTDSEKLYFPTYFFSDIEASISYDNYKLFYTITF